MTQTLSVSETSIQAIVKITKDGDEIVLEENGKPIAKILPIEDRSSNQNGDSWNTLLAAIEENQIETETPDLAHQHDHYLYGTSKRD
jgi:antitoxin (DNA-binding transcriptional repressor) of toxin-antitoxin stability system